MLRLRALMSVAEVLSLIAVSPTPNSSNQLAGWLVLAVIIAVVSQALRNKSKKSKKQTPATEPESKLHSEEPGPLAYQLRPSLLTKAENSLYGVLLSVVAGKATVFAKVRVSDIVTVPRGVSDWKAQLNRVNSKHVDFVICDSSTMRPVAALELDDASHERLDRQERDSFLAEVFTCANLPLIRVPAKHAYALDEIRFLVEPHIPIEERTAPTPPVTPSGGSIIVNLPPSR